MPSQTQQRGPAVRRVTSWSAVLGEIRDTAVTPLATVVRGHGWHGRVRRNVSWPDDGSGRCRAPEPDGTRLQDESDEPAGADSDAADLAPPRPHLEPVAEQSGPGVASTILANLMFATGGRGSRPGSGPAAVSGRRSTVSLSPPECPPDEDPIPGMEFPNSRGRDQFRPLHGANGGSELAARPSWPADAGHRHWEAKTRPPSASRTMENSPAVAPPLWRGGPAREGRLEDVVAGLMSAVSGLAWVAFALLGSGRSRDQLQHDDLDRLLHSARV